MELARFATRHIKAILFVTVALCAIGAWMVTSFPVSILPDVTFPRIVMTAEAGDRPARMLAVSVTRPIEQAVSVIPGVHRVRSKTQRGATEINIDFDWGTDMIAAEQLVNARVNEVRNQLPPETQITVERMNPTVFPILGLSLQSSSLSQSDLWSLATYTLRPRLARVPGVARVVIQGGRVPEIAVDVDPNKLAAFHLSLMDVEQALTQSNMVRAVGLLNRQFQQYQTLVSGQVTDPRELGSIAITQHNGVPIYVREVASIHPSTQDQTMVVTAHGQEAVLINIIRQPSANTAAVADAVKAEMAAARSSLPADTKVSIWYDQSVLVREAVSSVRDAVLIGAALAVVVLLAFLANIRATVVTAAIIPATVLITFLFMRISGLTLNLMTLGALAVAIGLVVDDAIVVVENVFRHMGKGESRFAAVQTAASEIAAPMVSSTLTTVVVFLPLVMVAGVAGAFFTALAVTLTIALLVSLGLALMVSPSLCAAFLRRREGEKGRRGKAGVESRESRVERTDSGPSTINHQPSTINSGGSPSPPHPLTPSGIYPRLLRFTLRHRWIAAAFAAAAVAVTLFLAPRLQTGFMPSMDEGAFILDYFSPPGTTLAESNRLLMKVEKILQATPEVASFSRRTGTELGFAVTEANKGDFAVTLKPTRHRSIDEIMDDVRDQIGKEVPGLDIDFSQALQDLVGDLAGTPDPVEIKLFSENQQQLEEVAPVIADKLGKIPGCVDVRTGIMETGPEMVIQVDPATAGRVGMTASAVADQVNAGMFGDVVTQILQGDRQIGVRVRFPAGARADRQQIEMLPIHTPAGFNVPLSTLGTVEMVPGSTEINHENQRRLVSVTSRIGPNHDLGSVMRNVQAMMRTVALPAGMTFDYGGYFQSQQESFRNLLMVLALAIVLVFAVMLFQFGTFTAPSVILLIMPLSLFGVVFGLWVTGTALNVSSFMGAIMLVGIVVKNGILLLDRAQHTEADGMDLEAAAIEAGRVRLRPILMTTLTAILGLVPLAFGLGAGAQMQQPLAVAVIGGLSFSTLFTLVLAPVLWIVMRRWQLRRAPAVRSVLESS